MGFQNGELSINDADKKSPPPNYDEEEIPNQGWFGTRHFVTFMLFLGMANAYVMRTNMSVAIVAMVNQTAIGVDSGSSSVDDECDAVLSNTTTTTSSDSGGEFVWETDVQGYVLSSFFYGYVITQIPFGILAKKYGNIYFLGIGMLINSVFGLLVPVAAYMGIWWLIAVRFIQGLGEGPIVPCTHSLLAKWIPPNERSRMGAFVYAGIILNLYDMISQINWATWGVKSLETDGFNDDAPLKHANGFYTLASANPYYVCTT